MAEQKEKVSQEDASRRRLAYEMAHTVLVACEACRANVHWLDLLGHRLHTGGWALPERFFVREAKEEGDIYSYFCPDGHFTDGRALPASLQEALHKVLSEVVEPVPILQVPVVAEEENVCAARARFRPVEEAGVGQYL